MAKQYTHPYAYKVPAQTGEDSLASKAKVRKVTKRYWVINKRTNRRSSAPVTMERFLDYVGRNYAVAKGYELVPA